MDFFEEISENKFTLLLLSEKQYEQRLAQMMKSIEKAHKSICYICLSKPYKDVMLSLDSGGFDVGKFFFIDVLTHHFKRQEIAQNCIFVEDPRKLMALQLAIAKAVIQKNCSAIIFDTLSSLLMYEQAHDVIQFANAMAIEEKHRSVNKVFIVVRESQPLKEYSDTFIKDVEMFADKKIEFE